MSSTNENPPPTTEEDPDPLAGVPSLTTTLAITPADRIDGLKLIADSVAQQRQTANSALIAHPLNLAGVVAACAVVYQLLTAVFKYDWILAGLCVSGVVMSSLIVTRYITQDYLFAAEAINFEWVGEESEMYVTRFGEEVIGAAVVEWVGGSGGRKGKGKAGGQATKGVVKAWTVRLRYRNKSVGSSLLEAVCKVGRSRGVEVVEFADDHAHAKRVLPTMYNGIFDKREKKSRELLEDLWESSSPRGKKK